MTRAWSGHHDYPFRYEWDFTEKTETPPPDMAFPEPEPPPKRVPFWVQFAAGAAGAGVVLAVVTGAILLLRWGGAL